MKKYSLSFKKSKNVANFEEFPYMYNFIKHHTLYFRRAPEIAIYKITKWDNLILQTANQSLEYGNLSCQISNISSKSFLNDAYGLRHDI